MKRRRSAQPFFYMWGEGLGFPGTFVWLQYKPDGVWVMLRVAGQDDPVHTEFWPDRRGETIYPLETEKVMQFVKRGKKAEAAKSELASSEWLNWKESHPAVAEYLSLDKDPDTGKARKTATLLFFVDAGMVKVCLNDRQEGESLFVSGSTPETALEALEMTLQSGSGEWRSQR